MKRFLVGFAIAGFLFGSEDQKSALNPRSALKVIREKCLSCHVGDKPGGGLRLNTVDNMVRGGKSGVALVPYWPADSLLYRYLEKHPVNRLGAEDVLTIRRWIENGALQMSMGGQEP